MLDFGFYNMDCMEGLKDFPDNYFNLAIVDPPYGSGMKTISDTLTVIFDRSLDDESGICVSRVVNGKVVVLKMELGEQADILYHLLTEQTAKAEIKAESEVKE